MKKITGGSLALITLLSVGSTPSLAQEEVREARGPRGPAIESVMSMRERLELTDEQISRLDELRARRVEEQSAERAEVAEMRSRLRAGQIRRSELMAFMEDRRDARREVSASMAAEIDEILLPDQRSTLEQLRGERRAFERGRRAGRIESGRRGSGVRGERGAWRGPRGARRGGGGAGQPG